MLQSVLSIIRSSWKSLLVADLFSKLIAFIILTPLVSLLFRLFLSLSGREILADTDIATFFLHPIGWLTLFIVGGTFIATLLLQQSLLMTIGFSSQQGLKVGVLSSVAFAYRNAANLFIVSVSMIWRLALLCLPFLAVGGAVYWLMLTDHDINYYLTEKPPKFYAACGMIGSLLAVMIVLVARSIAHWFVALPLLLFERHPAAECLHASRQRLKGHEKQIITTVLLWLVAFFCLSLAINAITLQVGEFIVPNSPGSLYRLAFSLGTVVILWSVTHYALSLLGMMSFSSVLVSVYSVWGMRGNTLTLPDEHEIEKSGLRLTRGRVAAVFVLFLIGASLIGAWAIHSFELNDHVAVTAHRGASGRAPENSMASVEAAIEDQADWVEIDVQETSDGAVVVIHDSDLMKVGGPPVKVWNMTSDQIRSIDIGSSFSKEFADQRVPLLADVLKRCKGKIKVNIELKYYGHDQDLEQRVIDLVEAHGMQDQVAIMSLDANAVAMVRRLRPDWYVGLLTAVAIGDLTRKDVNFLAVNTSLATQAFVLHAHQRDKEVAVWTVNDSATISRMLSRGVDNLITDEPKLARKILEERASMSPLERLLIAFGHQLTQ